MTTAIVFLIGVAVGIWLHNVWQQPWWDGTEDDSKEGRDEP